MIHKGKGLAQSLQAKGGAHHKPSPIPSPGRSPETQCLGKRSRRTRPSMEIFSRNLTELPELDPTTTSLNCSINQLTVLPMSLTSLPLFSLNCQFNRLVRLPSLQLLRTLNVRSNQLTELPDLPLLKELYCCKNQLIRLPALPALNMLTCAHNKLTELTLPSSLTFLVCNGNPIKHIPVPPRINTLFLNSPSSIETIPKSVDILAFQSMSRLDDASFMRVIDHLPYLPERQQFNTDQYRGTVLKEIMKCDLSIHVLKHMLSSPYFDKARVLDLIVKVKMIFRNLQQLPLNDDLLYTVLSVWTAWAPP